ncbi:DUF4214 domain-containing protein [Devosia sp. FJ2-5-3]|uniref:DUF4214 domain-containing protein n=1 Tax=Devosia sp. FJ2-5-3 TaxID=2976680 RepID=UPI0023D89714|nr:DUF4214 domain-containing protein [Devosia sp. FJ2-5-3]WEJ59171.1 DUF4214 domain-containing protein [Devosia sp. FJ2-5-3]
MATQTMTIGDLKGFIDLSKSMVGGLTITSFDALFNKIEELLRSFNQWTPELEANLKLARAELNANPQLFEMGKAEFISSVDALLAKYPPSTLLSDIPELGGAGGGGSTGNPVVVSIGDIDIARIQKVFAEITAKYDPVTKIVTVEGASYSYKAPNIERLQFNDGILAFDIDGAPGQMVRLYKAAFNRDPDDAGLGFWIRHQDDRIADLKAVAAGFMGSAEFAALYGTEATVSNSAFVGLLYTNALGREKDQAGFDFWVGQLESGQYSRQDMLLFFADSAENKATTAPGMADGIWYV